MDSLLEKIPSADVLLEQIPSASALPHPRKDEDLQFKTALIWLWGMGSFGAALSIALDSILPGTSTQPSRGLPS